MILKRSLFITSMVFLLSYLSSSSSWAGNTYYVASGVPTSLDATVPASGIDTAGRGSSTAPFKTIQYAAKQAVAGDTVIVRNGLYTENVVIGYDTYDGSWTTTATGTGESTRIIFRAENRYHAFVRTATATTSSRAYYLGCFNVASSDQNTPLASDSSLNFSYLSTHLPGTGGRIIGYITIDGFDMQSNGYNGLGVAGIWAHHVQVINNRIHDCGSGGVQMIQTDYSTIDNNIVYNNCRTSSFQSSGISLLRTVAYDTNTGYHNRVRRNQVYGNYIDYNATYTPGGSTFNHTDGNGIIIDTCPFDLGTLVENNAIDRNGGPGIILDGATNTDIVSNTCYGNNTDIQQDEKTYTTNRGEITLQQTTWAVPKNSSNPLNAVCKNVRVWGNICYPKANYTSTYTINSVSYTKLHSFYGLSIQDTSANCSIKNNWLYKSGSTSGLVYKPTRSATGYDSYTPFDNTFFAGNYGGELLSSDPQFVSATNFHLKSTSPCTERSVYAKPVVDLENYARPYRVGPTNPEGNYWDLGAYEYHP